MRLIDADEFLEYIEKEKALIPIDAEKYHIDEKVVDGMNAAIRAIENEIKEQPTAYDIEKVVEELKEWSFETEIVIPTSDGFEDTANREIICTLNAIDVVRKGGVDE